MHLPDRESVPGRMGEAAVAIRPPPARARGLAARPGRRERPAPRDPPTPDLVPLPGPPADPPRAPAMPTLSGSANVQWTFARHGRPEPMAEGAGGERRAGNRRAPAWAGAESRLPSRRRRASVTTGRQAQADPPTVRSAGTAAAPRQNTPTARERHPPRQPSAAPVCDHPSEPAPRAGSANVQWTFARHVRPEPMAEGECHRRRAGIRPAPAEGQAGAGRFAEGQIGRDCGTAAPSLPKLPGPGPDVSARRSLSPERNVRYARPVVLRTGRKLA